MAKVEEMKSQRMMLIEQFRNEIHEDDITKKLVCSILVYSLSDIVFRQVYSQTLHLSPFDQVAYWSFTWHVVCLKSLKYAMNNLPTRNGT